MHEYLPIALSSGPPQSASQARSLAFAVSSEAFCSSSAAYSKSSDVSLIASVEISEPLSATKSDSDVRGTASAVPVYVTLSVSCADTACVARAATRYGKAVSIFCKPSDALLANLLRVLIISIPVSTILPATGSAPGMRMATKPVPIVANPASPKLKMLASTTVAAV